MILGSTSHVMLIALQRLFSAFALIIWFGGFTFYTSSTVRIGSKVIGGLTQGYITQRVTDRLNLFACVMAVGVLLDIAVRWKTSGKLLRFFRSVNWLVIAVTIVMSFLLHVQMNEVLIAPDQLDIDKLTRPDHAVFSPMHQRYQMINTILWVAALIEIMVLVLSKNQRMVKGASTPETNAKSSATPSTPA